MKKWVAPVAILLALIIDFTVFSADPIRNFAPDCLVAVFVSLALVLGTPYILIAGIIIGIAIDAVANPFIGGMALSLTIASVAGGAFHRKFYADNVIVPGVFSVILIFLRESGMYLICKIMGRNLAGFSGFLFTHILPSAVLTGVVCAISYFLIKRQNKTLMI